MPSAWAPRSLTREAMSADLSALMPALAEASRTVGSPQIRNRGTIGGNLGTASPQAMHAPPLLVAGRKWSLASAVRGTRRLPPHEPLTGPKRNALEADELDRSPPSSGRAAPRRRS